MSIIRFTTKVIIYCRNLFNILLDIEKLRQTRIAMKKLDIANLPKRVHSCFKRDIDSRFSSTISTSDNSSSIFKGKIEDYTIGKEIGQGAYASVKLSNHKPTSTSVAIKVYDKLKLNDMHKKNACKREIEVLKRVDNQYIVKFHEVIETTKQVRVCKLLTILTLFIRYLL